MSQPGHAPRSVRSRSFAAADREDVKDAPARRRVLEIGEGGSPPVPRGRVPRIQIVADDRSRPSADAGEHGDVLMTVGAAVGDRLADDAGAALELPQLLAGLR